MNNQPIRIPVDFGFLNAPKKGLPRKPLTETAVKPREVAQKLYRGMALFNKPNVTGWAVRGDTVSWRIERNGSARVQWFTATAYAPGLIRLRNDLIASVPRKVWPFALPSIRNFELTFYWDEISEELGQNVFMFCNAIAGDQLFSYDWDLFRGEECYPQYAWTQKAKENSNYR